MKKIGLIALPLLTVAAAPPEWTGNNGVQALGWMSGAWIDGSGNNSTEERWSRPKAGVMLGTNLTVSGSLAKEFEFLRIAPDEKGRVTYWASPQGRKAVPFPLVTGGNNEAVFENPKHGYPTTISYRREGNRLIARISGPGGSNPMTWNFKLSDER
jgi:hypothetical protein